MKYAYLQHSDAQFMAAGRISDPFKSVVTGRSPCSSGKPGISVYGRNTNDTSWVKEKG